MSVYPTSGFDRSIAEELATKVGTQTLAYLAAPIIFDFDNDGVGLVSLSDSRTRFDMNGDGIADLTGWIEQGDAFLVIDRNENGKIDDIGEISFVGDKVGAKTDLEGLTAFDSNADGVLDGGDERFVQFKLWFDRNSDGKTDAGELLSLSEAKIMAINLAGTPTGETATPGANIVYNRGTATLADGQTKALMDAGLAYKPLPEVEYLSDSWDGKDKNYRIASLNGELHITPRSPQGAIDVRAGLLEPLSLLSFKDGAVGLLTTILVDLDGDGLEARRRDKSGATFDMDGDGSADDTGWVSGGDGMLVIDRDGDGKISTPAELSFLAEKLDARSAWDGLATLDQTKDGKLNASDARFADLRIWVDANANGVSEDGELKLLSDFGMTEISLATNPTDSVAKLGWNVPLSTSVFTGKNGITGTIGTVALAFEPSRTVAETPFGLSNDSYTASAVGQATSQLLQAMSSFGVRSQGDGDRLVQDNQYPTADWLGVSAA